MTYYITKRLGATLVTLAALLMLSGCGERPDGSRGAPTTIAPEPATAPAHRIVVLGDSIAAGYGLAKDEAFPALVERALRDQGRDVEVVNAGVSGDTTAGGLARLDWVLQTPASVLVVELGGNDALRGQALGNTETNLREIVRRARATGATVIVLGMDIPTNYGERYPAEFSALYGRVAAAEGATFVPGFVQVLGEEPSLLLSDGLHPNAEGHKRLAEVLLPALTTALDRREEPT